MANDNKVVTRKIRSEYMKKFRDPKWSTFSKNYEDSVKYRLTRRVMEQTHNPLYGDGWDSGSESSGRSSPNAHKYQTYLNYWYNKVQIIDHYLPHN